MTQRVPRPRPTADVLAAVDRAGARYREVRERRRAVRAEVRRVVLALLEQGEPPARIDAAFAGGADFTTRVRKHWRMEPAAGDLTYETAPGALARVEAEWSKVYTAAPGQMATAYLAGVSMYRLGQAYGLGRSTVWLNLKGQGVVFGDEPGELASAREGKT